MGIWYENARDAAIRFEKGDCQVARYSNEDLATEGKITVINSQWNKNFIEPDSIKGFATCQGAHCNVNFKWYAPKGDYRVLSTDYN